MENQLVTIEQSNQITILSTESGVKGIVQQAKEAIHNLDGGSMKTAVGRKKIRSNAFKATKLKTSLKERADELVKSIEDKIAPELKTIKAIKDNQKTLGSDLDQLRKDVNAEVDDHETELKRIADEAAAKEKAIKDTEEKELLWDFAISENKLFNIEREAERARLEAESVAESARLKQVQIDNDARIAKEAAEAATIEAERLAQKAIDDAQEAKQKAINDKIKADNELLASQAREKLLNEQAAQEKINNEWLEYISEAYEWNANIDRDRQTKFLAQQAEIKRLADIETARQAEVKRQQDQLKADQDAQAKLEANKKHAGKILGEIKEHIMATCGLDEPTARKVVLSLRNTERVTINY